MKKQFLLFICFLLVSLKSVCQQSAYIPPDGSFTLAMGPNDDGSSSAISLPFSFCLYGVNYTSIYINNNGNVSFGTSYSSFSSTGFPSASYTMIAPFWADVDTRSAGTVQYKTTATAIYINWDAVGYYSQQADKINSFQIILTNSTDPILPTGNNIGFFYGDMQWTTGAASSGTNGFGGVAATVGINKGDGSNYFQIGRFDQAGTAYDGAQGASDGVDWLDNKHFYFDGCTFPTASIIGTTTICNNTPSPYITLVGGGGTAPYTFTYTLNGGSIQTISTTSGDSVTIAVPTNTTGSYTYSLVSVQSAASSTVAQTQGNATVTVNPCTMATASISGSDTVCKNATSPLITFTGSLGTAPYTFTYTINGGTNQTLVTTSDSSATVNVPTNVTGIFTYSLISVKDATATTPSPANGSASIHVVLPTAAISGSTEVCQYASPPNVIFVGSGGIAPYTFTYDANNISNLTVTSIGDSAVVSLPTVVPGTFTFNLVSVKDASPDSCSQPQTGTTIIKVNPLPTATIVGTQTVCMETNAPVITFKGTGGTAPYSIVFAINGVNQLPLTTLAGDSVIVNAPTDSAGTFVYSLVSVQDASTTACIQTQTGTATITVKTKPKAAFGGANVCLGNAVQFHDSSSTPIGTLTNWSWNFGDNGNINITQNPSYAYANAGIYSTTLTVTNSLGCTDSVSKNIKIYYNPVASFSHVNVCLGDSIHFTNTSTIDSSTSIASYLWVFGDGSATSNLTNPIHAYSSGGTFNVAFIVTSIEGCTGVVNVPVKTFAPPTSQFTFNNSCLHDSALFNNTSLPPADGNLASWLWSFGDSTSNDSAHLSASHVYDSTGTYTVTLITRSSNLGCADTLQDTIQVFTKPTAAFNFVNVCVNNTSLFYDSSTVMNDSIILWNWDFGDNSVADTSQNATHIYTNAQQYSARLTVTTNHGCSDTISQTTSIHPLPTLLFSSVNVCDGTTTFFNNLSSIPSTDTIASYLWSFGDGSTNSTSQETSHLYSAIGSYNVTLTALSTFGCIDSITKTSIVNPLPIVYFSAIDTIGCEPLCVAFQDLTTIYSGSNTSWNWSFGDDSTDTAQHPHHCFLTDSVNVPFVYNVTLTVTSDSGCSASKTIDSMIIVYPQPIADFNATPLTTNVVVATTTLTDLSIGATTWAWDFGDSGTDTSQTPQPHLYNDTGTYLITLITSTAYGCYDTAYKYINIEPDFAFYVPNTFTPNADGKNDVFFTKGVFVQDFDLKIFDRWGNLVFQSNDINEGWDGKANFGKETAQQDIYVYSIHLRDNKKQKHYYNGTLTIIR